MEALSFYFPPPPLFWVILGAEGANWALIPPLILGPKPKDFLPNPIGILGGSLTLIVSVFAFDIWLLYNIGYNKLCEAPNNLRYELQGKVNRWR